MEHNGIATSKKQRPFSWRRKGVCYTRKENLERNFGNFQK